MHYYRGYGLLFESQIELPELAPASPGPADIKIAINDRASAAFKELADPSRAEYRFARTSVGHVMNIPDHAVLLVSSNQDVVLSPSDGCDMDYVRLFIIGSVIGILFHLRGQLVLHGAAVLHDAGVSVFVGESGAGKSTLAAHMCDRGFSILSDDTLPITQRNDGSFVAWPGSRVFKLWRDALDALCRDVDGLREVQVDADKFFTPNPAVAPDMPHQLIEVIVLSEGEDDAPPHLERLPNLRALQQINENAYRPQMVRLLGRETPHFEVTAALAGAVRTYRLTRPWNLGRIGESVDTMLHHWNGATLDSLIESKA
ncbi:MAG: hypothetical protein AAF557_24215 [Pseudomonadota bacterium]